MAVPYFGRLAARLGARFHVQVELVKPHAEFQTPAAQPVEGRVVRVFRGKGRLLLGQQVTFAVHVCRRGDRIWPGTSFMSYEDFVRARYMEVFLNGAPPGCVVALDEVSIVDRPSRRPQLRSSRVAYYLALLRWKLH